MTKRKEPSPSADDAAKPVSSMVVQTPGQQQPAPAAEPLGTFEADGVTYKFTVPSFVMDGKQWTAAEAMDDDELLAKLVEMGAGVIAKTKSAED